ncbi:pilus assembly protein PilP [Epibacterium ulvae]|uniref:pilus assembly protein PilP n=1 Tax=Epibacterium ulvae TaxID=1156985 RepID=UPI001BFCA49B|nr:pilus assembly protein PilP [Epibacterium ulvae]MBT8152366.1 pilus assembly protein PilP [Epibacterium ulvae]
MGSNNTIEDTPKHVAQSATQSDALPTGGTVLVGIFGATTAPEALVRTSSGRVRRVKNGSRVASGQVVAIDEKGLLLQRGGQTQRLQIPGS